MTEKSPATPRQGVRWGRGFFRLWLVLSVMWIAVILLVAEVPYYVNALRQQEAQVSEPNSSLSMPPDRMLARGLQDRLRRDQGLPPLSDTRFREIMDAAHAATAAGEEGRAKTLFEFAQRVQAEYGDGAAEAEDRAKQALAKRKDQARRSITSAVQLAVIPPIIVLLIGAMIAWALRGFQK